MVALVVNICKEKLYYYGFVKSIEILKPSASRRGGN